MENLKIRCKSCGSEIEGKSGKTITCGCSNMTTILRGDHISAVDLSQVVMLTIPSNKTKSSFLTKEDIAWQEERRKRKVRKLDFEIR
jgi:hypothetical protein